MVLRIRSTGPDVSSSYRDGIDISPLIRANISTSALASVVVTWHMNLPTCPRKGVKYQEVSGSISDVSISRP
jgi:hypothetical protein